MSPKNNLPPIDEALLLKRRKEARRKAIQRSKKKKSSSHLPSEVARAGQPQRSSSHRETASAALSNPLAATTLHPDLAAQAKSTLPSFPVPQIGSTRTHNVHTDETSKEAIAEIQNTPVTFTPSAASGQSLRNPGPKTNSSASMPSNEMTDRDTPDVSRQASPSPRSSPIPSPIPHAAENIQSISVAPSENNDRTCPASSPHGIGGDDNTGPSHGPNSNEVQAVLGLCEIGGQQRQEQPKTLKVPPTRYPQALGEFGIATKLTPKMRSLFLKDLEQDAMLQGRELARDYFKKEVTGETKRDMLRCFEEAGEEGLSKFVPAFMAPVRSLMRHICIPLSRIISVLEIELRGALNKAEFRNKFFSKSGVIIREKVPEGVTGISLLAKNGKVYLIANKAKMAAKAKPIIALPLCYRIFGNNLYACTTETNSFRLQSGYGLHQVSEAAYFSFFFIAYYLQEIFDQCLAGRFPRDRNCPLYVRSLCFIFMYTDTDPQLIHRDDYDGMQGNLYGQDITIVHGTSSYFVMTTGEYEGEEWELIPSKGFDIWHVPRPLDNLLTSESLRQLGCLIHRTLTIDQQRDRIKEEEKIAEENGTKLDDKVNMGLLYEKMKTAYHVGVSDFMIASSSAAHAGMGLKESDKAQCEVRCACGPSRTEENCGHVGYGPDHIPPPHIRRSYFNALTRLHFMLKTKPDTHSDMVTGTKLPIKETYPCDLMALDEQGRVIRGGFPLKDVQD